MPLITTGTTTPCTQFTQPSISAVLIRLLRRREVDSDTIMPFRRGRYYGSVLVSDLLAVTPPLVWKLELAVLVVTCLNLAVHLTRYLYPALGYSVLKLTDGQKRLLTVTQNGGCRVGPRGFTAVNGLWLWFACGVKRFDDFGGRTCTIKNMLLSCLFPVGNDSE